MGLALALSCDVRIAVLDTLFNVDGIEKISNSERNHLEHVLRYSRTPSWIQEVVIRAGKFGTTEAVENGIISSVWKSSEEAMSYALDLAKVISSRDMDEVEKTKRAIVHARDSRSGKAILSLGRSYADMSPVYRASKAWYPEREIVADLDFVLGVKSRI